MLASNQGGESLLRGGGYCSLTCGTSTAGRRPTAPSAARTPSRSRSRWTRWWPPQRVRACGCRTRGRASYNSTSLSQPSSRARSCLLRTVISCPVVGERSVSLISWGNTIPASPIAFGSPLADRVPGNTLARVPDCVSTPERFTPLAVPECDKLLLSKYSKGEGSNSFITARTILRIP